MRKEDFNFRLFSAATMSRDFALEYVKNKLSNEYLFHVLLNQSADHKASSDQDLYPNDDNKIIHDLSLSEVVDLLCRDNKVPQWIDVSVIFFEKSVTHIELRCGGRYTEDCKDLYYYERGTQPFGIKSPILNDLKGDYSKKLNLPNRKKYMERVIK